MSEPNEKRIYVEMMEDSLRQKKEILNLLYDQTKEQESLLTEEMDVDRFEELLEEKGNGIDKLNKLDDGFDGLFKKLEKELTLNRGAYEEEINHMKKLIKEITELSASVQVTEKRNEERFQKYLKDERAKLREANKSQQTAMNYVQNMNGYHKPGDSYFVNETK